MANVVHARGRGKEKDKETLGGGGSNTVQSGALAEEELQEVTVELGMPDVADDEAEPFIKGDPPPPPVKKPKTPREKAMAVIFYWCVHYIHNSRLYPLYPCTQNIYDANNYTKITKKITKLKTNKQDYFIIISIFK